MSKKGKTSAKKADTTVKNNKPAATAQENVTTSETSSEVKDQKEEDKNPQVQKPKETEQKKPAKPKKEPEVIVAEEVIEPTEDSVPLITGKLGKTEDGRIDRNHAIDLASLIHKEYLSNPDDQNSEMRKAMKSQFDVMMLSSILQYNAQVESDMQSLGVKVNNTMFVQMEKVAREILGITLRGLPSKDDPNQKVIVFDDVPQDIKEIAKKDAEVANEPVPEPDPNISDEQKYKALRIVLSKKDGLGKTLQSGIDWFRHAFKVESDLPDSAIVAKLAASTQDYMIMRCFQGMAKGKLDKEHSVLGAHALLKNWLPAKSDKEISNIVKVLISAQNEKICKDWNEKTSNQTDPDNNLALINRNVIAGCASKVIDAILNETGDVVVKFTDGIGEVLVDTVGIRKSLVAAYGDSNSILKDKLKEIAEYYVKPIVRLAKYEDKSAYSE